MRASWFNRQKSALCTLLHASVLWLRFFHRPKKKTHKRKTRTEAAAATDALSASAESFELVRRKGSGRVLSSGTTLMGQPGTRFLLELHAGDALIVQHPTSLVEETRIVRMVLSDVSAAVSSAFSSDLVSSTPFYYIKAPPDDAAKESEEVSVCEHLCE